MTQKFQVEQYEREDGKCPFAEWFDSLPYSYAGKVQDALYRMESGNLGDAKSVGGGLWERRIKNPVIRIYFARQGGKIILLLNGGTKRRQSGDIACAQELLKEYKARKKVKN